MVMATWRPSLPSSTNTNSTELRPEAEQSQGYQAHPPVGGLMAAGRVHITLHVSVSATSAVSPPTARTSSRAASNRMVSRRTTSFGMDLFIWARYRTLCM